MEYDVLLEAPHDIEAHNDAKSSAAVFLLGFAGIPLQSSRIKGS